MRSKTFGQRKILYGMRVFVREKRKRKKERSGRENRRMVQKRGKMDKVASENSNNRCVGVSDDNNRIVRVDERTVE